ncbi:MAG TPA: right-handed parallel beta-helix repeat-containing protein [Rubrobacteraceae bacterium]|nr:right-handed parallel beta-helix repeat-containing protein [Rubrobacteraceae bacterium]
MSGAPRAMRLLPKTLLALAALALAGVLLAMWSGPADAATTFTVNKTGDGKDRRINGVCDASRTRGQQCTLRAAIQEANATSGADTINFNIGGTAPVKTIKPASPLPNITDPVTIDGYTQSGTSENTLAEGNDAVLLIQLNGTDAGGANGLVIQAADSTVKGLVINRFAGNGVLLSGSGATDNKIEGNFIGTNAAGTADLGNGDDGVDVFGADNNTIGGTATGARNILSGNGGDGVQIVGGLGTTGNEILGNYIGTDKNGTSALGNTEEGVLIFSVSDNTVGGTTAGARNVISGNNQDGVQISGNASIGVATGNQVLGNLVGT